MRPVRALVALLLAALALTALSACGSGDDRLSELQRRAEQTRHKLEARADRLRRRGRGGVARPQPGVPQAPPQTPSPAPPRGTEPEQEQGVPTPAPGRGRPHRTR